MRSTRRPSFQPRSGLLAVKIDGGDYLMWFRPEVIGSVSWAGDPHYKRIALGPNGPRLTPRGSFATWNEEQRGKSGAWGEWDRDAAKALRDAILAVLARTASALEAEARRRDDFLAAVAHELRNPLGPIRNAVYLFRLAAGNPEGAAGAADMIDRQAAHLNRLIDDLLDASRAGRGKLRVDLRRVDLGAVVRAATEDGRPALEAAGLELVVFIPAEAVWIKGDPHRLAQVVGNLLGNSGKFTDRGGRVTVTLTAGSGETNLSVADTGIGIPVALLPHLFDPFVQAEESVQRSKEGLGLGLALVKALIGLHGGDVRVESEGPGRGATFSVRIPLDSGI
jgi:chemotaxis family two-component system sensor kinase Cph1